MAAVVVAAAPLTVLAATHATFRPVLAEPGGRALWMLTGRPPPPVAATTAEMTLEEAVAEVLGGRMSQRQAATAAGVSRHAVASAVSGASATESAA